MARLLLTLVVLAEAAAAGATRTTRPLHTATTPTCVYDGQDASPSCSYDGVQRLLAKDGVREAGFTGHRTESALGLSYAKRRWLDSSTGTWLSRDDIGAASYLQSPNELNPWLYAAGNPTRYTDPDGRCLPGMGLAECVTFDTVLVGSYAKRRQELRMQGAVDLVVGPLKAVDALVHCAQEANPSACGPFRFTIGMDQGEKEELARLFARSSGWDDLKAGLRGRDPVLLGRGFATMEYELEQFANMVAGTAAGALGELPTAPARAPVQRATRQLAGTSPTGGPSVPPGAVPVGGVPPPLRVRVRGVRTSPATVDDVVGRSSPLQMKAVGGGKGGRASTGRKVYRYLSPEDRVRLDRGEGLEPAGTGGSIAEQVAGEDTGYISAGKTKEAIKKFEGANGLVEIDVDAAEAAGAKYIDHPNVVQAVKKNGTLTDVKNAREAQEVLFKGPIPKEAIKLVDE